MKLSHFLIALLSSSATVLGQGYSAGRSKQFLDLVCTDLIRCAALPDLCGGYNCGGGRNEHYKPVDKKPPVCVAEGQKCYSKDDCCDYLECNLGAKNKKDKVCQLPCIDLHEECKEGLKCCDKKALCQEKSFTEKVCYKNKYKKEVCEDVVYKTRVCEYPPCVPAYGDCSGGKHCCDGFQCRAKVQCRTPPCSEEQRKKDKCPYPECRNVYQCNPELPPPPPPKCPQHCNKSSECCIGYKCKNGWCKK